MIVRALASLLCLLVAGTPPAQAQPLGTVFLEELTWTELRDLIGSGKTTIIIPIGGTEQNGPDMALGRKRGRQSPVRTRASAARPYGGWLEFAGWRGPTMRSVQPVKINVQRY